MEENNLAVNPSMGGMPPIFNKNKKKRRHKIMLNGVLQISFNLSESVKANKETTQNNLMEYKKRYKKEGAQAGQVLTSQTLVKTEDNPRRGFVR